MKIKVIKTEEAIDIIHQYENQLGTTISKEARDYLEEQIEINSIEIKVENMNV